MAPPERPGSDPRLGPRPERQGSDPAVYLGSAGEIVDGDLDDTGQLVLQLGQRVALHLTHSLAAHAQLAADLLEGRGLSLETEPQLEHSTLTLGELLERIPDELPAQCVTGLL